ncbi:antitoxin Xre/MbcA/ParS toxin-binding domain-containing protein [Trichloromonas sp.]|uniref:antitoxin Xre/MbcA/ParS toxin-binding domain-containing protein n=1 Tax=Trichloromonas sp. TaxID=3069249 RepID=UPI002A3BD24A|nr:MbcA/ParS/Xre antitoxin family protein [Trichloromonas sp.]
MEPLVVIYLGLSVFLLIACAIILHDQIIDRRARKESRSRTSTSVQVLENRQVSLLRQVIAGMEELPDDASFTQIKAALDRAAFQSVPESVRCRALEVFGDEASAAAWLTTRIVALGGQTPINTLMRADGEEEVLTILGRIEHGICS